MQIENNKEEIPFAHYEAKFRELNPQDAISRLPGVTWDGKALPMRWSMTDLWRWTIFG